VSERVSLRDGRAGPKEDGTLSHEKKPVLSSAAPSPHDVSFFQTTIGNRSLYRVFKAGILQPKLKISQPDDIYEQEADRIAHHVTSLRDSAIQEKPTRPLKTDPPCRYEGLEHNNISDPIMPFSRRTSSTLATESTDGIAARIESFKGSGNPLSESVRAYFEPRFGKDLSDVRVHTNTKAAESARAINARAFTIGNNIVFEERQYAPETNDGRQLLAHELTHTIQQDARRDLNAPGVTKTNSENAVEQMETGLGEPPIAVKLYEKGKIARQLQAAGVSSPTAYGATDPEKMKTLGTKRESDDIRGAIDLFSKSRSAKTATGRAVLARLKELYKEEEIGLEEMQLGLGGEYRTGISSWGTFDLALNEQQTFAAMAFKMVHEAVHALEIKRHALDDELAAFTFESEYYMEMKENNLLPEQYFSIAYFLELKENNREIDFLFPMYSKDLDVDWISAHIDEWGGISNRLSETKAAYVNTLLEAGDTHKEMIFKIVSSPAQNPFEYQNMIRKIGEDDLEKGIKRLKEVLDPGQYEELLRILQRYQIGLQHVPAHKKR